MRSLESGYASEKLPRAEAELESRSSFHPSSGPLEFLVYQTHSTLQKAQTLGLPSGHWLSVGLQ